MNPVLAELLHGAGLSDIVIPHQNLNGGFFNLYAFRSMPSGTKAILSNAVKPISESLIPALGQVAEHIIPLIGKGDMEGGKVNCGAKSGFIRRLMYENSLKHDGQYKYPVWKLHKDSTMDEPFKFDYKKIANEPQRGENESAYGASPFIQKHFGTHRAVEFVRGRKAQKGDPKQESEAQREQRKIFRKKSKKQPQQSVEQQEERQPLIVADNKPEVAKERVENVAEDDQKYAEEHSAERTQSEYDRMFPKKSASKEKESLRKKTAYQLKKEAKQAEEEAEERRRNPEPEISDALKEELRDFAEKHPGRSPFQLGEMFARDWNTGEKRITNAMTKREGLETPKDTPYRQSGEYKLSELVKKWYAYQQKHNNLIKPVPKGSIPVDESQASKQNFTEQQLGWLKYYGKDLMKGYDKVGEYAIPEDSSHIPSIVDAVLWANNVVEKGRNPKLTAKQVIYYLQKNYGLK